MGTGHPRARPHSGGGSFGGGKGQAECVRMGHTEGDCKGERRNLTPGGAGRRRSGRKGRRRSQAEDALSPLRDGVGSGSPAESCLSRMARER